MDTPGGTVAGTMDLATEVAKATAQKPTDVFIEDLTASAGMWVASQARRITANNATALVGSLGTFAVLHDMSKMADRLGVKVHVIRAGEFKGMATPGTEVTEKQLAELQRVVNAANDQFVSGFARGRNMSASAARQLFDGRIHPAHDAIKLGLVDGIRTIDQAVKETAAGKPTRVRAVAAAAPPAVRQTTTAPDPWAVFHVAVKQHLATHGGDRISAVRSVAKAKPALHQAAIASGARFAKR